METSSAYANGFCLRMQTSSAYQAIVFCFMQKSRRYNSKAITFNVQCSMFVVWALVVAENMSLDRASTGNLSQAVFQQCG